MSEWITGEAQRWLFDLLLAPALLLGLGLGIARLTRPALGHAALSAALFASLIYLPLSIAARSLDWGFFSARVSAQSQSIPFELWGLTPAGPAALVITLGQGLCALWIVSSAGLLLRLRSSYVQAKRQLSAASHELKPQDPVAGLVRELCSQLGIRQPRLCISSQLRSPLAWGLGCPLLLLPEALVRLDRGALRGVLIHELSHLQRRDGLTTLIARLACIALPFHPLVWIVRREHERLAELACDERVVELGADAPLYAEALLSLASLPRPRLAVVPLGSHLLGTGSLEERIVRVLAKPPTRSVVHAGVRWALLIGILALASSLSLARSRNPQLELIEVHKQSSVPPHVVTAAAGFIGEEIRVYPAELDLGSAPRQTERRGSLWIVNHGTAPRRVLQAKPTCGCLTLSELEDLELGPGEAVELPLSMLATAEPGKRAEKRILVRIEGQPVLEAKVSLQTTP